MCSRADNSCREEKLGCEGCYYNKGILHPIFEYLVDTLEFAIKNNILARIYTKNKEYKIFLNETINICRASKGTLKYSISVRGNIINIYRYGNRILKIINK